MRTSLIIIGTNLYSSALIQSIHPVQGHIGCCMLYFILLLLSMYTLTIFKLCWLTYILDVTYTAVKAFAL